jgi:hypothetical protein
VDPWPEPPRRTGLAGTKIALLVVGALFAMAGFAFTLGGATLVWAHATQRDSRGFYHSSTERFTTSTYALTSRIDLGRAPGERGWTPAHALGTLRVRARGEGSALFIGIAPQRDVDEWLAGVPYERVTGANFGPFESDTEVVAGTAAPSQPGSQGFWDASTSGTGTQTLSWPSEGGRWAIVVMNADAHRGVAADVSVGARTGVLLPIGIGLGAFGLLLLGVAGVMAFLALRGHTRATGAAPQAAPLAPGAYPVRLDGRLEPGLSRWLWLVKWILVVPHVVVLTFLGVAAVVMTVVAGFAILFTGRYPRAVFDFNVGVMRWAWRVSFYAMSAFATDRYPPFSLRPDPTYPAELTVEYPETLSKGLVLVKWWLLALPHYLVVAFFTGGWDVGWRSEWRFAVAGGGGLITLLAFIAVVVLAVRGRYPESIFDFVMGMNRWCYRVLAYAALMRDEYPPFRLDTGGVDPGSVPLPPAPTPDRGDERVPVGRTT